MSVRRAHTPTTAPAAASSRASAAPIPDDAPVTSTRRPVHAVIAVLPLSSGSATDIARIRLEDPNGIARFEALVLRWATASARRTSRRSTPCLGRDVRGDRRVRQVGIQGGSILSNVSRTVVSADEPYLVAQSDSTFRRSPDSRRGLVARW